MPLTAKGEKIKSGMEEEYGAEKGESVFYASANKGTITGVHDTRDDATGYTVDRIGGYKIIEGSGPDGGYWFASGRGETKRFRSRREAEDHAYASREDSAQTTARLGNILDSISHLASRFDSFFGKSRGDAEKGAFVMLQPRPTPTGKSGKLRARVTRVFPDGRIEVKVVSPGLYEGAYEILSPGQWE